MNIEIQIIFDFCNNVSKRQSQNLTSLPSVTAFGLSLNFPLILSALSLRLCNPLFLLSFSVTSPTESRIWGSVPFLCFISPLYLTSDCSRWMSGTSVWHSSCFQERVYQLQKKTKTPFLPPPLFTTFRIQLNLKKKILWKYYWTPHAEITVGPPFFLFLGLLSWVINIPMKSIQKQCRNPFKCSTVTFDLCLNPWQQSSVWVSQMYERNVFFSLQKIFEILNKNMQLGTSSSVMALMRKILYFCVNFCFAV